MRTWTRGSTQRLAATLAGYGLGVAGVGVATLITVMLPGNSVRGVLFVPVILVAAWYGGMGPGLFSAVLSVLAINFYVLQSRRSFLLLAASDATYIVVFGLAAAFVAWLAATQRRQKDELQQQASLLDLSHDAVFVRDKKDVITYWNGGAAERYGWTREEATGQVSHQLTKTIFPAPLPEIEAELLRTGRWEGRLVHAKRDGTKVVVASRWSLQRDAEGNPTGVLETNNDVTEQTRAGDELRDSQAELARVTRLTMLGEITASLAHEINQPLAAVVMNGNACRRWLDATPPNIEEALQAARRVVGDGERAGQVIARVRSLVRKTAPERIALNVNDVIQETLAFTRVELEQHRVAVRTELNGDLPAVVGDRVQLQQVLVNLILNGIDAMGAVAERSRRLTIESLRKNDNQVGVAVSDSGKGFSPEDAERIFDAFFSTKATGLGMGLSVSRSIIEQHGGKIWAVPNKTAGATLHFTLPAGVAQ